MMHKTFLISKRESFRSATLLAAGLSLCAWSGCDTLWNGFTIADPRSCASPRTELTCQAPQVCNPNSGQCEDGTGLLGLNPNLMPMSAGQPVEVTSSLLTKDTVVKIAGQALLPPLLAPAANQTTGIVAKSPGRCGPVDVELVRSNGQPFKAPGAFTYTFEPFSVRPPNTFYSSVGAISKILLANIDDDPGRNIDILLRTSTGPQLVLNPVTNPTFPQTLPIVANVDQHIAIVRIAGKSRSTLVFGDAVADATARSQITILTWDETKSMYVSRSPGVIPGQIKHMLTLDSNHDGTDEVVIVSQPMGAQTNSTVTMMYNSNSNWSIYQNSTLLSNQAVIAITTGDINNDKIEDLLMITANQPGPTALYGLSWDGVRLNPIPTPVSPQGMFTALATGDWDGDSRVDIALTTGLVNPIFTLLNKQSGWSMSSFNTSSTVSFYQTELLSYDVNCDKKPDLVVNNFTVGQGNWSGMFVSNGNGGFAERRLPPVKLGPLLLADLNTDSLPDILSAASETGGGNPGGAQFMLGYSP